MTQTTRLVGALMVGVLALGVLGVDSAGANPNFDLAVAKAKSGPYKTGEKSTAQPDTNPQVVTRKVAKGDKGVFFLRFENSSPGEQLGTLGGDLTEPGFKIKAVRLDTKTDITAVLENDGIGECTSEVRPGNSKLFIKLVIRPTTAPVNTLVRAPVYSLSSNCITAYDIVWPSVRVK